MSVNYVMYPKEYALIPQRDGVNVINFMGESLYGNIDQNMLAFKNIVSCTYKEVDNKIISGPEYKMTPSSTEADEYHNLTFVDTSQTNGRLATFSCDKTTVYDAGGSKLYQRNYDNFVNLYAEAQEAETTAGIPTLIIVLETVSVVATIVCGLTVRCAA